MPGDRYLLLVLMVLAGPILWLAGVAGVAAGAYAAVAPDDLGGRYFISGYAGPARTMVAVFAFLNLLLLTVFMPTSRQLRTGRPGTYVRAAVTSVLALALARFESLFNPVTTNWGGDPDAWSMVRDHVAPEASRTSTIWFAITATAAAVIAVWAISQALMAGRPQPPPPGENPPGENPPGENPPGEASPAR